MPIWILVLEKLKILDDIYSCTCTHQMFPSDTDHPTPLAQFWGDVSAKPFDSRVYFDFYLNSDKLTLS